MNHRNVKRVKKPGACERCPRCVRYRHDGKVEYYCMDRPILAGELPCAEAPKEFSRGFLGEMANLVDVRHEVGGMEEEAAGDAYSGAMAELNTAYEYLLDVSGNRMLTRSGSYLLIEGAVKCLERALHILGPKGGTE